MGSNVGPLEKGVFREVTNEAIRTDQERESVKILEIEIEQM